MSREHPASRLFRIAFLITVVLGTLVMSNCGLFGVAASAGLIKLQFGCLPEGTLIDTPTGPVPVETLSTGDRVIGFDGSPVVIRQLHQYQEDPSTTSHLVVRFDNAAEVSLSPRHRIGGIPARDLAPGDTIAGHVVTEVRALPDVSRSFDLLTDDKGYRIGGIPVNSMIEEMAGR